MNDAQPLTEQKKLIDVLVLAFKRAGRSVQLFETHISWVLVADDFAYKFKKAVRFDFVDYSTLDNRHFYCDQELRLNRRLAPRLYLSVVPVTGPRGNPVIDGAGQAIEYAVKMRAFEQQALWSYRLDHRLTLPQEVDQLAGIIAGFHRDAARAPDDSGWATPAALQAIAEDNLDAIMRRCGDEEDRRRLDALRAWDPTQRQSLPFMQRRAAGRVRECHGDLHADNILTIDSEVQVFDCIEFNDSLRWIDVMNDIAFTCMDLAFRQYPGLANRFLNRYLEATGDYEGLAVLRYYEIHRALVRCKVALLLAGELRGRAHGAARQQRLAQRYLDFASRLVAPSPSAVVITHGFSGSGKTTLARSLAELSGAIQVRSDVERKRMRGLAASARAAAEPGTQLYDAAATRATYARLRELARQIVGAGRTVIVDAAFLQAEQRAPFQALAAELGVPFVILDIRASEATMRSRIARREASGHDASDAGLQVLAHQLADHDPLSAAERGDTIIVDTSEGIDAQPVRQVGERLLRALQGE